MSADEPGLAGGGWFDWALLWAVSLIIPPMTRWAFTPSAHFAAAMIFAALSGFQAGRASCEVCGKIDLDACMWCSIYAYGAVTFASIGLCSEWLRRRMFERPDSAGELS